MAIISDYKKSIHEIGIDKETESIIWDFYVTRSFASSASQKRTVKEFGIKQIPLKQMIALAGISDDDFRVIPCTTMPGTIRTLGFETVTKGENGKQKYIDIDIDKPRICCIQKFTVTDDKGIVPSGSVAECLMTHIRNAFAHGNTYFFDNGNVLLEDKDGGKITAMILISFDSLIGWIKIIDSSNLIYPNLK